MNKEKPIISEEIKKTAIGFIKEMESRWGKMEHLTEDNRGRYMFFAHDLKAFRDEIIKYYGIKDE